MKKYAFLLLIAISFAFVISSCQDQTEENLVYKPKEVVEPPEALAWNRSQAYVTAEDVLGAEYVGINTTNMTYYNEENGETIVTHENTSIDIYKIKARKYYGWDKTVEYVSSYKETYQISASVLSFVRNRVKEAGFAICRKRLPNDESNYTGLDEIYSLTGNW